MDALCGLFTSPLTMDVELPELNRLVRRLYNAVP